MTMGEVMRGNRTHHLSHCAPSAHHYYEGEVTLQELADQLGVTKQCVDLTEKAIFRRLWQMGLERHRPLKEKAIQTFIIKTCGKVQPK